jgi:hypothetical protein
MATTGDLNLAVDTNTAPHPPPTSQHGLLLPTQILPVWWIEEPELEEPAP